MKLIKTNHDLYANTYDFNYKAVFSLWSVEYNKIYQGIRIEIN